MKKQNNQRRQSLLPASIATIFLLAAFGSTFAQTGSGAKFGSRDARTCADTKAPGNGAMTAAIATKYVICSQEKVVNEYIYLVEDLTVQVGGAVPYNANRFPFTAEIDTKAPVYPIRASFKQYQCHTVNDILQNKGYNCNIYTRPNASGVCVKTTFGDWSCEITSADDPSSTEYNIPPPGKAKAVADNKEKTAADKDQPTTADAKNNQPKNTTKADNNANENQDENGLPKPDFSEMEKYFEIVRYEYDSADHRLNILVKMTKKINLCDWDVNYYDADGVKVIPTTSFSDHCQPGLGEPTKTYALLPDESKWKFVKKVVVTRHIY